MATNDPTQPYSTEAEIEAVVKGFEDCSTPKEDFTHARHLTVAVWYLWHSNANALEKMRESLLRFLRHHEVQPGKYQEELTRAWLELIEQTMAEFEKSSSLVETTNRVIERLGDSRLITKVEG